MSFTFSKDITSLFKSFLISILYVISSSSGSIDLKLNSTVLFTSSMPLAGALSSGAVGGSFKAVSISNSKTTLISVSAPKPTGSKAVKNPSLVALTE